METIGQFQSWDCNLEAAAHEELSKCAPITKVGTYGFNDGTLQTDTKNLLNTWWNEVKATAWPANQKYTKKFRHFAPMVYDKSKGVGCTYTLCNDEVKMVCAYDQDIVTQKPTVEMYVKSAGDTCDGCKATCTYFLCKEPYTPGEI
ncbi:hypothetical protein ANCDUO_23436 [Ancylostoma duodenale]|uniref:SCP domain-containing protein n=1 Tax=Ancylostoma duodenale TaxID=51022 RepID=A0A0C2C9M4_9BILA|nr:hypothetical protein ANCDUO_23436 [Ancylostoma duodenale]